MKTFNKKLTFGIIFSLILTFSFSAAAQKRKPVVSKKAQIQKLKAQGFKEFQARNLDAAIESFTKCIELKPILSDADVCYTGRGTSYFLKEDYEKAIPDFGEAYSNFMNWDAMYLRGRSYFALRNYEAANKDFLLVITMVSPLKIKNTMPEIYGYRGATYVALDQIDKGIADYTKALELNPKASDFIYARGVAYEMKDDFPNAEKDLREAVRLDPSLKEQVNEVFERIKIKKKN